MAINKVVYGSETLIDLTSDTATAADVAQGKTFHLANGMQATGTASGGGGGSSWTHLAHDEREVSTTSTSRTDLYTLYTDSYAVGSAPLTTETILYVRIRDKAGSRAGYFAGSDAFIVYANIANGIASSVYTGNVAVSPTTIWLKTTASTPWSLRSNANTSSYGVFPYQFKLNHDTSAAVLSYSIGITISARYSSTNSGTIDGTYSIDVFALSYPDGYPSVFGA